MILRTETSHENLHIEPLIQLKKILERHEDASAVDGSEEDDVACGRHGAAGGAGHGVAQPATGIWPCCYGRAEDNELPAGRWLPCARQYDRACRLADAQLEGTRP